MVALNDCIDLDNITLKFKRKKSYLWNHTERS